MVGLPIGGKTLTIRLAVLTEYRRVTDRQTDGRTDILPRQSCAMRMRRAVKTYRSVSVVNYSRSVCHWCLYVRPADAFSARMV